MGVTAIKEVVNNAYAAIVIKNHENSSASASVLPHEPVRQCSIWIPWCASEGDFQWDHYLEVDVRPSSGLFRRWWIWQGVGTDGDFVRISTEGRFAPNQSHIAGAAMVTGDRDVKLVVTENELRLEAI